MALRIEVKARARVTVLKAGSPEALEAERVERERQDREKANG